MSDRLKIAWFTPFSAHSGIAKYSRLVTGALAELADIDLWVEERPDLIDSELKVIRYSQPAPDAQRLAGYDLAVYNLGNHYPFHRQMFEVFGKAPGVVVLHDLVMHHFFAAHYLEDQRDPEGYRALMMRLYGAAGRRAAEASLAHDSPPVWETDEVARYPLIEPALDGAWGVVVHSSHAAERVAASFNGPLAQLFLPVADPPPAVDDGRAALGLPQDKVLILTTGHNNPHQRIHAVVEALASDRKLAQRVVYMVLSAKAGKYYDELVALARRLGNTVRFAGFVPDEKLHAFLTSADICVNLRYPTTEGASWSTLEAMSYGKPLIVTDTGFYSELPDDCVVKIKPEREKAELVRALRALVADAERRQSIGRRAQDYVRANFRADEFARRFLGFVLETLAAKPALALADRLSARLARMGVGPEMEIVEKSARESYRLFFAGRNAHPARQRSGRGAAQPA